MAKTTVKISEVTKTATQVKAVARYVHVSPRKARLVADLVRGTSVGQAVVQLQNLHKASAKPVLKLLLSAIANAEHNFKLAKDKLKISTITVDGGPPIKRWKVRGFGRASAIRRPTSHIFLILEEGKGKTVAKRDLFPVILKRAKRAVKPTDEDVEDNKEVKSEKPQSTEGKGEQGKPKRGWLGIKKGIFNRRGGEK